MPTLVARALAELNVGLLKRLEVIRTNTKP